MIGQYLVGSKESSSFQRARLLRVRTEAAVSAGCAIAQIGNDFLLAQGGLSVPRPTLIGLVSVKSGQALYNSCLRKQQLLFGAVLSY